MDLPFSNVLLLLKPLSMDLQNALSVVFHTVPLLTKEVTSQPEKYDSGPATMEPTDLIIFLTILKKLI